MIIMVSSSIIAAVEVAIISSNPTTTSRRTELKSILTTMCHTANKKLSTKLDKNRVMNPGSSKISSPIKTTIRMAEMGATTRIIVTKETRIITTTIVEKTTDRISSNSKTKAKVVESRTSNNTNRRVEQAYLKIRSKITRLRLLQLPSNLMRLTIKPTTKKN